MNDQSAIARLRADLAAGKRAAALYDEARALADANVDGFVTALECIVQQAEQIAAGGDIYPGVRDLAQKLAEHAGFRVKSLHALTRFDLSRAPIRLTASLDERDLEVEMHATAVERPTLPEHLTRAGAAALDQWSAAAFVPGPAALAPRDTAHLPGELSAVRA